MQPPARPNASQTGWHDGFAKPTLNEPTLKTRFEGCDPSPVYSSAISSNVFELLGADIFPPYPHQRASVAW